MQPASATLAPTLLTISRLKYLLGEQLVRIGPVAPDLAASLSSVAIAQTTFGQARYFYHWYRGESRAAEREMTVDDTWAGEVALLRFDEWSTWPHLVTILWLVDEAIATLSQEWADTNPAVAPLLDKVREEVAHTLLFTREWVEIFIYQGPGLQGLVRSVAGALGPQLTRWLGEIGTTRAGHFDSHWQSTVGQGSS